jgi:glucosyl-dolichyl phosphate glucuronosyltransferase
LSGLTPPPITRLCEADAGRGAWAAEASPRRSPVGNHRDVPPTTATLVIPTFRRPTGLDRLLESLTKLDDAGLEWDVLVVDNDDPPGADAIVEQWRDRLPVRLVREGQRGSAHARNRGGAEAAGDLVVFVDDDVVAAPNWLRALVEPILAGRCDATDGTVILDPAVPRPRWFDEPGLGGYLAAHAPADAEREVGKDDFLITATLAVKRHLLLASGGFDPQLGPRAGVQLVNDDVLLTDRLRAAGGRLCHAPAAEVVHELPPSRLRPGYLVRRSYTQGRSDWVYLAMSIGRRGAAERQRNWIVEEMRRRFRAGITHPEVAFHAVCDVSRFTGSFVEALRRRLARPVPSTVGTDQHT